MPITLVIADDHPLILDAMENLFRLEKDLKIVARCLDGDEALKAVRRHKPDIFVLDIQMPAKDGIVLLREMRKEKLPTRVVTTSQSGCLRQARPVTQKARSIFNTICLSTPKCLRNKRWASAPTT